MSRNERDEEVGGSSDVVFFTDSHTEEETGGKDKDAEILFGLKGWKGAAR